MSIQEAAAQVSSRFSDHCGELGSLYEPYYGQPYPLKALAPEAFWYGRARIAAADLQRRLPDALDIVESREECFGFGQETKAAIDRVQKQFRDFVALCARKEEECGIPCMIVAD